MFAQMRMVYALAPATFGLLRSSGGNNASDTLFLCRRHSAGRDQLHACRAGPDFGLSRPKVNRVGNVLRMQRGTRIVDGQVIVTRKAALPETAVRTRCFEIRVGMISLSHRSGCLA